MRVLLLDTNYAAFTGEFWVRRPDLEGAPYATCWRALMDQCFGTADFYSHNLAPLGHEAHEVVLNDENLQRSWAREHDVSLPPDAVKWKLARRRKIVPWLRREVVPSWMYAVVRAQVEWFRPDVFYVQDINFTDTRFLREVKARGILLAGQTAYPLADNDLSVYDVVFTSFPHYLDVLKKRGTRGRYFRIGFERRVLEKLGAPVPPKHDAVFGGGLSPSHAGRIEFLERVARAVPLDVWGYGAECLAPDSPLRARHHGTAWGLEMYRALQGGRVALNFHIDVAESNANNMRLYEATGVGSCLLTDAKRNLGELFEVGREVVAYENEDDCIEKLRFLLENERERAAIASAGQARTLREHSYARRMEELATMLNEELERRS